VLSALAISNGECWPNLADLGQSLFLWMEESVQHFRNGRAKSASCAFRTYAGGVVTRRLKDVQRNELRRARRVEHSARSQAILEGATNEGVNLSGRSLSGLGIANPEAHAIAHEERTRLQQALSRFSPEDRQIILGWSQDFTEKEIGIQLGACAKTVARRLQKLMKKLARDLNQPLVRPVVWRTSRRSRRKRKPRT
jgi:RNA polymerase sigma factor (sigma-70 family)